MSKKRGLPWYFGFVVWYAGWATTIAFVSAVIVVIGTVYVASQANSLAGVALAAIVGVLVAAASTLGVLLAAAVLLLVADIARSLRIMRPRRE